uniref:Uncharacterized protein n=1 Tax=Anguilla anguilla TaxID=7936 RepID=A0A0E9X2R6_ANGAN
MQGYCISTVWTKIICIFIFLLLFFFSSLPISVFLRWLNVRESNYSSNMRNAECSGIHTYSSNTKNKMSHRMPCLLRRCTVYLIRVAHGSFLAAFRCVRLPVSWTCS